MNYNTVSKRAVLWARPYGVYDPWTFVDQIHPILVIPLIQPPPLAPLLLYLPHLGRCRGSGVVYLLVVVIVCCCVLCCFHALSEGSFGDLGHKCEPFLCVDVDCHGNCLCLWWE
jgi:hypothetical protein